ncbi:isochorismatase family protein [candidate division KSB1 bacterium]|nr:isochorismatase family protein [candidate division KSB1 bacterium]MBL7092765.1 isochorismatase family protein [candidate division KSB1 bacterium]
MLKEDYLTAEKSLEIYYKAKKYSRDRQLELKPDRLALLIVDMQDYFLKEESNAFIPSAPVTVDRVIHLMEICKTKDIPIVFTKHINKNSDAQMMKSWWKNIIEKQNPLSEIYGKFNTKNCTVIEKTQYDPFYETDLEKILKDFKTEQILICGVMTNLCCETFVRTAFVRGFEPFLPIDLTAAYNYQFHLSTIINLSYGFTIPVLSYQIFRALEK